MNRESEEQLLALGAAQAKHFDVHEWQDLAAKGPVLKDEVAAAALFLAGGYWYGHEDELFQVADSLAPGCRGHFAALSKKVHFDCSRFNSMLKARIRHESRHT